MSKIETAMLLTKVVAFTAHEVEADGIYWGAGTLVHSPEFFGSMAFGMSREVLPLYLWIDFRVNADDENSFYLFSTGMKQFGLMEIEILKTHDDPEFIVDRAFNIAHYLLDNGPILKDGDTIGLSAEEKIKIRHLPSAWDATRMVYQLQLAVDA